MDGSYKTQVKAPDGACYGHDETSGQWEQLTAPDEDETTVEPYQMHSPIDQHARLMASSSRHAMHFKTSVVLAPVKFSDVPILSWSALF